ncbi:hypothetical protein [Variovorax sp. J22R115]|uniref:hypothetical protein n=1 Tax=Variovorax sp. J22R115 TaxID=3053509 RepID=UPI0025789742|nr:hypothetical protein [Variovorax sp. J22R115]MDM0049296.1 hypothetical protein [Variovorax sp. J22R115]
MNEPGHPPSEWQELESKLAALEPGSIYAPVLVKALAALHSPESRIPAHRRFLDVCNVVDLGYSAGEPSEKEILANTLTVPLVRYVLRALRSYHLHASKPPDDAHTSHDRADMLTTAFGARGPGRGGNTRAPAWSIATKMELVHVCSAELGRLHDAGVPYEAALRGGFRKAYEHKLAFNSDDLNGRPESQSKKNRTLVRNLLEEHGYVLSDAEAKKALSS